MTPMKIKWIMLALATMTSGLLAAEPNAAPASEPSTNVVTSTEDIADQAALVQQIGEDAARGFDPVAHAHELRLQMEALISAPSGVKAPAANQPVPMTLPSTAGTVKASAPTAPAVVPPARQPRESAIQESIQKLRAVVDQLERQLNGNSKN